MEYFALAGNILQFSQLAAQVVNAFYQAYRSGCAISSEVVDNARVIEKILADMKQIRDDDENLRYLVETYIQIAEKLLCVTDELKIRDKANIGSTMVLAIKGLRKRKKIEQLLQRLELFGSAIILKLSIKDSREITSIRMDIKEMRQLQTIMRQTLDSSYMPKSLGYSWETSDPEAQVTVDDGLGPIYSIPIMFCVSYQKFQEFLLFKFESNELPGLLQVQNRHLELWDWTETSELSEDNWSAIILKHRRLKVSFIMATPFGYSHDLCYRCQAPQNRNTYTEKYNTCSSCNLSVRWVSPDTIPYEPQDTSVFLYQVRDDEHQSNVITEPNLASDGISSEREEGSSLRRLSENEASRQLQVDQVCRRLTMKWEPIFNTTHRYFACRCIIRRSTPSRLEQEISILRFAICPRHNNKAVSFRDYQEFEDPNDDPYFDKFGGYDAFRAFIHCCLTQLCTFLGGEKFLEQGETQNAYDSLQTAWDEMGEELSKVHQEYIFEHDDMLMRLGFTAPDNIEAYITAERKKRGLDQAYGMTLTDDQLRDLAESPMEKEVETILNGKWKGKLHWLPGC